MRSLDMTSGTIPYAREFSRELVTREWPSPPPTIGIELRQFISIFLHRWPTILLSTLIAIVLMIAFIWNTAPLYQSTAELLVDPRQKQILSGNVTPTGLGSSALGADTYLLDSQVQVIESQSVMERIIREEGLLSDPEFVGTGSDGPSLLGSVKDLVKSVIYGPNGARPQMSSYDRALKTLDEQLTVRRLSNTYVIAISMLSTDPEKAARIANQVAAVYVAETTQAVAQSTGEAAAVLDTRLNELRVAAESADAAVENYKAENGLLRGQDSLVIEQQMSELNVEVGRARVETDSTRADLDLVQGAVGPDGIDKQRLASIDSPVMQQLLVQLALLEAEQARLRSTLLPSHPEYAEIIQRKAAQQASIESEYARIVDRLEIRYETAAERQRALEQRLSALEQKMTRSNLAGVHLRELERTASANRTIYETFLQRSKEATEQVGLPSSTARIISSAYPSSRPDFPKVPLFLMAAAALGLLFGVALAWVSHILGRGTQQVPRFSTD